MGTSEIKIFDFTSWWRKSKNGRYELAHTLADNLFIPDIL